MSVVSSGGLRGWDSLFAGCATSAGGTQGVLVAWVCVGTIVLWHFKRVGLRVFWLGGYVGTVILWRLQQLGLRVF